MSKHIVEGGPRRPKANRRKKGKLYVRRKKEKLF
jgi:hypothetical protein